MTSPAHQLRLQVERRGGRGAPARGFTLIELGVALVVVVLLMGAVVMSVGAITGARAKQAAGELSGTIRSLYDTAALSGKTCRLAFSLPAPADDSGQVQYWAECASKGITTSRDRDTALEQDNRRAEDEARKSPTEKERSLQETLSGEEKRIESEAKFAGFTNEEVKPQKLPSNVRVGVWTRNQAQEVTSGTAYLYFFPQGFTERAMVFVRQGNNAWTITVSPLTGKTQIVADALEVPRS